MDLGSRMPDLALTTADGAPASLEDARAGGAALVYFMRTSTCPVCHAHLRRIAGLVDGGALGDTAVVVVVPGEPADAALVRGRHPSPRLTVLASGDGHGLVGLGRTFGLQHSGTFLVAPDGTLAYTRTAAVPLQSFDETELLARLTTVR